MEFEKFRKIPRLSRDCIISEKLDGSNSSVVISQYEDIDKSEADFLTQHCLNLPKDFTEGTYHFPTDKLYMFAGSRNRWLSVDNGKNCDNYGFACWVKENAEELLKLGKGRHFGEWMGNGINRNYSLDEKRFVLFNVHKWHKNGEKPRLLSVNSKTNVEKYTIPAPKCCHVVPILFEGMFNTITIDTILMKLKAHGSYAVPGFDSPEGVVIYHKASGQLFKKTVENDEKPKGI